ncbi:hypothetical protein [Kibdelosporangium phytohabitans]|uniref:Uncharacterized protein n=1 Tax=Kibdelosporangium phytohabitans TaxID=860235 RepID=A0A0N9ICN0_9PSEU|nr:hypothetical protein [Kibdelosporangium phytohabitans]ALG12736.1 hypothetical protein AOZ06_43040 [Kibdelosporangium phytohabitans]MBE1464408.1 hypothetical protein [Kibdelosporangium phytohabitans]
MAGSPTTEVRSGVVDLASFQLDELRSDKHKARAEAAVNWALAYACGPSATAVQVQDEAG